MEELLLRTADLKEVIKNRFDRIPFKANKCVYKDELIDVKMHLLNSIDALYMAGLITASTRSLLMRTINTCYYDCMQSLNSY